MDLRPESEAALAECVASARDPLHIRGGGTRRLGTVQGAVLETGGLCGITLYEPGALTLVARAGTPLSEIEAALEAEGQRLAFEPMDHRGLLGTDGVPTIGGVVAGNVSGPRRVAVGACRDFMLGLRFVDGAGRVLKNGGRVMKNVTGYDLVKLLTGSWGTLGILTEVSLKVLPTPDTAATVLISGLDLDEAVAAMSQALGSPFEVSGAAHLPGEGPVTALRIEGFSHSVAYRAERLCAMFADRDVSVEREREDVSRRWAAIRDVAAFRDLPGDVWRISCRPSDGPDLARRLDADRVLLDWGGGLLWALLPEGTDARARLGAFGGHATLVRGAGGLAVFHPEPEPVAALSRGLRARFDPRGLLNPGLMAS